MCCVIFNNCTFLKQLKVHKKIERKVQRFPLHSLPNICTAIPIINITYQSSTFVTTDEPILTHHYHPGFIICIRMHSRYCTFYGLRQMCNDMCPPCLFVCSVPVVSDFLQPYGLHVAHQAPLSWFFPGKNTG